METGCTGCGGLSISWYFELDRNTLLRPAQSHLPGLDVWSVRTSIELTPNWQLNYCCTSIVNLLIWGIRQLGGRGGREWFKIHARDWRSKFIVRIIVLEYIIKYIIKFYFCMKIHDSPSAMTIGSDVKNNGYDHTHYLNISTGIWSSRNVQFVRQPFGQSGWVRTVNLTVNADAAGQHCLRSVKVRDYTCPISCLAVPCPTLHYVGATRQNTCKNWNILDGKKQQSIVSDKHVGSKNKIKQTKPTMLHFRFCYLSVKPFYSVFICECWKYIFGSDIRWKLILDSLD